MQHVAMEMQCNGVFAESTRFHMREGLNEAKKKNQQNQARDAVV